VNETRVGFTLVTYACHPLSDSRKLNELWG